MARRSLLVSDLDNTLLGDDIALEQFAQWYDRARSRLRLAYNSGRFPDSIRESIDSTALPEPDAIIGGVGSIIRLFDELQAASTWPHDLDGWDAASIRELFAEHPLLEIQPDHLQSDHKVSYFAHKLTPAHISQLNVELADAGFRAAIVYSSQRDLDVMPLGVDKGAAVEFLARHWQIDLQRVIVAGDSGNDRAMFREPFAGIVVGNALPELRSLRGERIYHAEANYAAGVVEGATHWLGESEAINDQR